ncbi:MAG: helix-turn-helix domain-containing protein [Candidatus Nanopelagicales bacterium]
MNVETNLVARARAHAALGDETRLAIIDALHVQDRAPSELQQLLGTTSNLLAHHLRVLEGAGVIERLTSEGDRRRAYLSLRADALAELLPGRRIVAPRVVFVCTHNSARSQLAAAIWSRASRIPTTSAGTTPAPCVHQGALAAARRHGFAIRRPVTRAVGDVLRRSDLAVVVCDRAHEQLKASTRLHWSVADPVPTGTQLAFDRTIDDLTHRIERLALAVEQGA